MKIITLLLLAVLSCTAATIGMEDWQNGDNDHNDMEYVALGLMFHFTGPFDFTAPAGYHETPFPGPAAYFDYAVATGDQAITFLSSQTSGEDTVQINVAGGGWMDIGNALSFSAPLGTRVDFRIDAGGTLLYADQGHAVATLDAPPPPPPGEDAPEPATFALIGAGLIGMAAWRRKR